MKGRTRKKKNVSIVGFYDRNSSYKLYLIWLHSCANQLNLVLRDLQSLKKAACIVAIILTGAFNKIQLFLEAMQCDKTLWTYQNHPSFAEFCVLFPKPWETRNFLWHNHHVSKMSNSWTQESKNCHIISRFLWTTWKRHPKGASKGDLLLRKTSIINKLKTVVIKTSDIGNLISRYFGQIKRLTHPTRNDETNDQPCLCQPQHNQNMAPKTVSCLFIYPNPSYYICLGIVQVNVLFNYWILLFFLLSPLKTKIRHHQGHSSLLQTSNKSKASIDSIIHQWTSKLYFDKGEMFSLLLAFLVYQRLLYL